MTGKSSLKCNHALIAQNSALLSSNKSIVKSRSERLRNSSNLKMDLKMLF